MPTLAQYLLDPPKLVGPDYIIYRFTDDCYKVVHFKSPRSLVPRPRTPKKKEPSEKKSDASLSRARRNVLELALCNDWTYFCTFTLDKLKYDRYNLEKFKGDFTQWIRDQRKKYKKFGQDLDLKFLLVPELHKNGAWHIHGLLGDISPLLISFSDEREQGLKVPDKLVNSVYFDWPQYREKFGFCSLGQIRNKVATGFYVSKYITKSLVDSNEALGTHTYIPSRDLNRATLHGSVYGDCALLDTCIVNRYEWVETGLVMPSDGVDWDWVLLPFSDRTDIPMMETFDYNTLAEPEAQYFETMYEGVQEAMEEFR